MSSKYQKSSEVPSDVLCARLKELADAITKGKDYVSREFTMRVPAECDRDADLVLSESANRIQALQAEVERLRGEVEIYKNNIMAIERSFEELRLMYLNVSGEIERLGDKANSYGICLLDCADVIEVLLQGETDSAEYKIMMRAKKLTERR